MTGEEYLQGIAALRGLAEQELRAIGEAQEQQVAVEAAQRLRRGDQVLAESRDRIASAIARSKSALQSLGLQSLPPGAAQQIDPPRPADSEAGLNALEAVALEATRLSAAQASAVEEHRRITAAAVRAEAEERRLAAEAQRAAAERERQRRARRQELARLRDQLRGLQEQRDERAKKWWRSGRRRELRQMDAALQETSGRIEELEAQHRAEGAEA